MKTLQVAVVREVVPDTASPDVLDTLDQARAVIGSLRRLGWNAAEYVLGTDPFVLEEALVRHPLDVVFNLVESHCGLASLACVGPALCRKAGLAFTGSDEGTVALAGDKAASRRLMKAAGVPCPEGVGLEELRQGVFPGAGRYIVKSRFEDASLGLDACCVLDARQGRDLLLAMLGMAPRMGGACVAERYVEGREFNLALLADPAHGVRALPLAEMVFDPTMAGPAILHYDAKWREGSAAHAASNRCFDFSGEEDLMQEMVRTGLRCWELFGLAGYARIDFRVPVNGAPQVIDVNPNPCIAPDSGFVAAALRAGLDHSGLVRQIVWDALRRSGLTLEGTCD